MNMALGTLYGWSVFVAPLEKEFHWTRSQTSTAFTIAVTVFALTFILAGRLQDKLGPFGISITGGVLVSLGFFLCAYTHTLTWLYVCFGVIGGLGNGFGLRCPDPRHGQMVSRQTRAGRGFGSGWIRRRLGHLRAAVQQNIDSRIRLAIHFHDSGRRVPGHDADWIFSNEEPAGRLSSARLDAHLSHP